MSIAGAGRKAAYAEYLKSEHWANLKKKKAEETPKVCSACKSKENIQLHHMKYRSTFEETLLEDTCWLCRGCHRTFHARVGKTLKERKKKHLLEQTVKVIQTEPVRGKRLSKKERRRIKTAIAQERNAARRALTTQRREAYEAVVAKKIASGDLIAIKNRDRQQFHVTLDKVKKGSALKSTLAGAVVFIPKRADSSQTSQQA